VRDVFVGANRHLPSGAVGAIYLASLPFHGVSLDSGASPELRGLPRRLDTEPELRSKLERYLHEDMTEREAFDAMRGFLGEWSLGVGAEGRRG